MLRVIDRSKRLISLALRLRVYVDVDGTAQPCDTVSGIFGGTWDVWGKHYVDVPPSEVVELSVTARQYEALLHPARKKMALGGRGGGKSHFVARWALVKALTRAGHQIQLTSPTYKKARII